MQVPRERMDHFRDEVRVKSWSFVLWLLARHPDEWHGLLGELAKENLLPEQVQDGFGKRFGREIGDVEQEWREWARRDSRIGKAAGLLW